MNPDTEVSLNAFSQPFPETLERIERWKSDPDVLGVVWVGSKSRGHGDTKSDDDLEVLLTDAAHQKLAPEQCLEALIEGEGDARRIVWDAQLVARSEIAAKASSTADLDHWPYERAPILFDRDGKTAQVVAATGAMAPDFRKARLTHAWLDAWVGNRRAMKTVTRNQQVAVRALLSRACRAATRVVFALESRWVPLDHWLDKELATLRDESQAVPALIEAWQANDPAKVEACLQKLAPALDRESVPTKLEGIRDLFAQVVHPSRAEERRIHTVV